MRRALDYILTTMDAEGIWGKLALARYYIAFLFVHGLRKVGRGIHLSEPQLSRNVILHSKLGVFFLRKGTADAWVVGRGYEPYVQRFLEEVLGLGQVFIDVGANIGRYTIAAARLVGPQGVVIAVEPGLDNYKALLENVRLNGISNVVAVNAACWSSDCVLEIALSSRATGFWHRVRAVSEDKEAVVEVAGKKLDTIIQEANVGIVDVIKIDVEGATVEVLKGGSQTLKASNTLEIVFEALDAQELKESSRVLCSLGLTVKTLWGKDYIASR